MFAGQGKCGKGHLFWRDASTLSAKQVPAHSLVFPVTCSELDRCDADDRDQFAGTIVNVWSTRERCLGNAGIRQESMNTREIMGKIMPFQGLIW